MFCGGCGELMPYLFASENAVSRKFIDEQPQILRLTTPKLHPSDEDLSLGTSELKCAWGPVRSG